jgi:hypothetical protein
MLMGQCLLLTEMERLDLRLPKRGKITLSGLVKCYVALLTLGKSDFEAIEAFRQDAFLREALGLSWVPGSVWRRQQFNPLNLRIIPWCPPLKGANILTLSS